MARATRYLTKTLFVTGLECPTKLYYAGKPGYANTRQDDPFLKALADGGFQVGALAQAYFPEGILVEGTGDEAAVEATARLLDRDTVTLFEPAFRVDSLFVRADILVKAGNDLRLIEVKAKLLDRAAGDGFLTRRGDLAPDWRPYLCDVAFQTYVLRGAMPSARVEPLLMLVNKDARCATDGLSQKLRIRRRPDGRRRVEVSETLSAADLAQPILIQVPVSVPVEAILSGTTSTFRDGFAAQVQALAEAYATDVRIAPQPGARCRKCEYRCDERDLEPGLRIGFRECWSDALGLGADDFAVPSVLDIWNYRNADRCIRAGRWRMADVAADLSVPKGDGSAGLSARQRQALQVQKVIEGDASPYLDRDGLQSRRGSWRFPLHFVDFETARPALPFTRGRRPYEGIAFQFSHHVVAADGAVGHAGEFLQSDPGVFPNYQFCRALREQLGGDPGTVFTYGTHEATFLATIATQLREDRSPPADGPELLEFIGGLVGDDVGAPSDGEAPTRMVDMLELVKRHYYDPASQGSNSLKRVLVALLNSSPFLRAKYGRPVYGARNGIPSRNFADWQWMRPEGDGVVDPYRLLPRLFEDLALDRAVERLSSNDELREGGAATTAWALMQFSDMSAAERQQLAAGLLRYCELDTLAMVMLYEGWIAMMDAD